MQNYLSRKETVKESPTTSNTEAGYFLLYCEGYANALWDMWWQDEIINHIMEQSWATNYEFFENQDSYTLVSLPDRSRLNTFMSEKIEEYDEELYNDLYEYCSENKEDIKSPKDLDIICLDYWDNTDKKFQYYWYDYVTKRLRDDLSTILE